MEERLQVRRGRCDASEIRHALACEMDEQFRQSALDRFEMIEAGVGGVELLDQLGDLLRELLHCSGYAEKAFSGHHRAQRLACFGGLAHIACEPSSIAACIAGVLDAVSKFSHLAFECLDRLARHGLPQHQTDLGEVVAQRFDGPAEVAGRRRILVASIVVWIGWRLREPSRVDAILQGQIKNDAIEPFAHRDAGAARGLKRGLARVPAHHFNLPRNARCHSRIRMFDRWSGSRTALVEPALVSRWRIATRP